MNSTILENKEITTNNAKPRIEYIDLMKGICIILVVMLHCVIYGDYHMKKMLDCIRMPLYFFLSGFFFKEYGGFLEFVIKKVNKLIVPFFFFGILAFIFYKWLGKEISQRHCGVVSLFVFLLRPGYRVLWFFRSLFLVSVTYYLINALRKHMPHTMVLTLIIIVPYISLHLYNVRSSSQILLVLNYCEIFETGYFLPFYAVGAYVHKINATITLSRLKSLFVAIVFGVMVWRLCLLHVFTFGHSDYFLCKANVLMQMEYLASLSGIFMVLFLCQAIVRLPIVSYIGRYSIIVYSMHVMFMHIVNHYIGFKFKYLFFVLVLLLSTLSIPIFKTLFPYFTAQKDLFVWRGGGLHWSDEVKQSLAWLCNKLK